MAFKMEPQAANKKSSLRILLSNYRGHKGLNRFKQDIASHHQSDTLLVNLCLIRPSNGSNRRQATYIVLCFLDCLILGFNTFLLPDPSNQTLREHDLHWNTLLGDLGLSFGTYRRIYNGALLVAIWCILNAYLILWRVFGKGVPDPWTFVWRRFLQTQEVIFEDQKLSTVQLTRRKKIMFWKLCYAAYLTAVYNACVGASSLLVFVLYSYYRTFPVLDTNMELVIHLCAAIWWTAFNSFIFMLGFAWSVVANMGLVMGIIFWIVQVKHVVKTAERRLIKGRKATSAEDQEWLLQRGVFISFTRWQLLKSEIYGRKYHWAICFAIGAVLFNMLGCGLIWFYAACYLGTGQPILKLINYLIAALVGVGLWVTLCVMSLLEHHSAKLPKILFAYAHAMYSLKLPMSRQSLVTHKLINSWLTSDACAVTPNVPNVGGIRLRLEPFLDVTFDNTLWLALETASYYLLTVATIGIPQDADR